MGDEYIYQHPESTPNEVVSLPVIAPPPPLTEAEAEAVRETRAMVNLYAPEVIPMIKGFHEAGLIDGWRSVKIKILSEDE